MKKVIFGSILLLLVGLMIYTGFRVNYLNSNNKELEEKINSIKKDIDKAKEDSIKYENDYSTLEEESKDKQEELEIWKKAETKLEKAL